MRLLIIGEDSTNRDGTDSHGHVKRLLLNGVNLAVLAQCDTLLYSISSETSVFWHSGAHQLCALNLTPAEAVILTGVVIVRWLLDSAR